MLLSNFYIDMEASINMEISKQQVLNDPEYKNFLLQKPTLSQASKDSYVVALKNFMEFSGEPFNEEMELSYEITENWLRHFNIPINKPFHVSGHARGAQLLDMIKEINPDVLYPVHTTRIELFDVLKDDGIRVIHPKNLNDKF